MFNGRGGAGAHTSGGQPAIGGEEDGAGAIVRLVLEVGLSM